VGWREASLPGSWRLAIFPARPPITGQRPMATPAARTAIAVRLTHSWSALITASTTTARLTAAAMHKTRATATSHAAASSFATSQPVSIHRRLTHRPWFRHAQVKTALARPTRRIRATRVWSAAEVVIPPKAPACRSIRAPATACPAKHALRTAYQVRRSAGAAYRAIARSMESAGSDESLAKSGALICGFVAG